MEYQYYDFRAIDRALTKSEMAAFAGHLHARCGQARTPEFQAALESLRRRHAAKDSFLRRLAQANL